LFILSLILVIFCFFFGFPPLNEYGPPSASLFFPSFLLSYTQSPTRFIFPLHPCGSDSPWSVRVSALSPRRVSPLAWSRFQRAFVSFSQFFFSLGCGITVTTPLLLFSFLPPPSFSPPRVGLLLPRHQKISLSSRPCFLSGAFFFFSPSFLIPSFDHNFSLIGSHNLVAGLYHRDEFCCGSSPPTPRMSDPLP